MKLFITLYLVGFLRTVFIILIIYFAIRLISKYVIPILFQKEIKNIQDKMNQQQREQQRQNKQQGDVTVQYNPNKSSKSNNQGEYVDFEEVE